MITEAQGLAEIATFLTEAREGLSSHTRWNHYRNRLALRRETILEHSLDTVFIAILVCDAILIADKTWEFDPFGIVACAALHDLGEIAEGDIAFSVRTDDDSAFERTVFRRLVRRLPQQSASALQDHYDVQNEAKCSDLSVHNCHERLTAGRSALVFEFVERFGYLCFAFAEASRDHQLRSLLSDVAKRQLPRLDELIRQVPGTESLFPKRARDEIYALTAAST